jgi:predicted nucleotidyltransferase component of viral defense system
MKYADAGAFRQALEQRLKDQAQGDGTRLARNRKRVVFDRFLARLAESAPERWLLKGGFALDLRWADRARATKDIDIDWQARDSDLLDELIDASTRDLGDLFAFELERVDIGEDRLGGSHRFRLHASLAERRFETVLLDVGLRSEPVEPQTLTTPPLLAFAEIEPVTLQAIPLEQHLAEKLHAYTRIYEGKRTSTRAKDLVDIALIATVSDLDAADMALAIVSTFARRATHVAPTQLPTPPEAWRTPYRELAESIGLEPNLMDGHALGASLIDPLLAGRIAEGRWNPGASRWEAMGDPSDALRRSESS